MKRFGIVSRRIWKWLYYFGVSATGCAILILGTIFVMPPAPTARVSSALIRSFTGIPVFMDSLEWGLDGHLEISNFKLSSWSMGVLGVDGQVKQISIKTKLLKSLRTRVITIEEIHVIEPKFSIELRPEKIGQTENGVDAGMIAAISLEIGLLKVEKAELNVRSPWGRLSVDDTSVNLDGFLFPEFSLAALDVGWKELELEAYAGALLRSEKGAIKARGDEDSNVTELNINAPYDIVSDFASFVPQGLATLDMELPDLESFVRGEKNADMVFGISLEDKKVLLIEGLGGMKGGRLVVKKGRLPAELLVSAPWLAEVIGSIEGSYLEWTESSAHGELLAQATGFLPLVKGVKAFPDFMLNIKLDGSFKKDGTVLGRLKGKVSAGNIYEQELEGLVKIRQRIEASLGMGVGQLDLKELSDVFPIAKQISLAGLITLEGPKITYKDSDHEEGGTRAELSALSKGVQVTWAEGKNEAVTIFSKGLRVNWKGSMPATISPEGLVASGTLTASQEVIELKSRLGALEIPNPVVNAVSRINLKPPFRTTISLSAEHGELLPPVGLLRKANITAEAWLSPGEGIQAEALVVLPQLGTQAKLSWKGFQGNLRAIVSPPADSVQPYFDNIEGSMIMTAKFAWPLPQPFRVDGAEITYSGLRFIARELDSGFLHGTMVWAPETSSGLDLRGHQGAWVKDLLPEGARGTTFRIKGLSYGNVEGDLEIDMVANGQRIILSRIQGNLMSGSILGTGLITWDSAEGIRYSLDFAASNVKPRKNKSGKGISLNANLRGIGLEPEGQANVVRISPKDLDALLLALDPGGRNENIVDFRKRLALGTPKNVTITVKHGQAKLEVALRSSRLWNKIVPYPALGVDFPLRKLIGVFLSSALDEG